MGTRLTNAVFPLLSRPSSILGSRERRINNEEAYSSRVARDGWVAHVGAVVGTDKERLLIKEAISKFPSTFRLRGHEGMFRISESASYVSWSVGASPEPKVMLYTQRYHDIPSFRKLYGREPRDEEELWVDFVKGSVSELRSQVKGDS